MSSDPSRPSSGLPAGTQPTDPQPVAYDQQGRPLYAYPPQTSQQPQLVYVTRPLEPPRPEIPEIIKQRAEESHKKYPNLNLSDGEYVITAVKRHPIGVVQIWFIVILLVLIFGAVVGFLFTGDGNASPLAVLGNTEDVKTIGLALLVVLYVLFVMGGFVATYIYNSNRFYLTNESVIQEIRTSLFSMHEQTVSLTNIEDASYRQQGIIQSLLNYGVIRLSTEGDETTYRFSYVTNPKKHIATLNNAVEAFKNGRPVLPPENPGKK